MLSFIADHWPTAAALGVVLYALSACSASITAFFTGLWQLVIAVRAPQALLGEVAHALSGTSPPTSAEDRSELDRHTQEDEQ
jgi:predicted benzoate:H+ symporter BenE